MVGKHALALVGKHCPGRHTLPWQAHIALVGKHFPGRQTCTGGQACPGRHLRLGYVRLGHIRFFKSMIQSSESRVAAYYSAYFTFFLYKTILVLVYIQYSGIVWTSVGCRLYVFLVGKHQQVVGCRLKVGQVRLGQVIHVLVSGLMVLVYIQHGGTVWTSVGCRLQVFLVGKYQQVVGCRLKVRQVMLGYMFWCQGLM